jgi:hypothetical protein
MSVNMDKKSAGLNLRIFFCQQIDVEQDVNRRVLEKELGSQIMFFPREGNFRARKRLVFAQGLIEEIGLKRERLELINLPAGTKTTIDKLARELLAREENRE